MKAAALIAIALLACCEPDSSFSYAEQQSVACVEMCGAKRVKVFQASNSGEPTCECQP